MVNRSHDYVNLLKLLVSKCLSTVCTSQQDYDPNVLMANLNSLILMCMIILIIVLSWKHLFDILSLMSFVKWIWEHFSNCVGVGEPFAWRGVLSTHFILLLTHRLIISVHWSFSIHPIQRQKIKVWEVKWGVDITLLASLRYMWKCGGYQNYSLI